MVERMDYKIRYNIERVPKDLVEAFQGLETAIVSDSMGRINTMSYDMKPLWRGARLCGPAVTVQLWPADNLTCHKAVEVAEAGDVLVIDGAGYLDASPWGELISLSCQVRGIQGAVIDGACRDVAALERMKFPVFARAVTPRGTVKESFGSINHPIQCGGIPVNPGDLIIGDDDGVVVIPRKMASEILSLSKARVEKEETLRKDLLEGKLLLHLLGLEDMLKRKGIK
jgi:4-hydroxy-4-methyl-2-oxoglutarate aldolase